MSDRGTELDPRRCQGTHKSGQCTNLALDGSTFCHVCIGSGRKTLEKRRKSMYHLTHAYAQEARDEFVSHEEAITLREEIAMTRIFIKELMNKYQSATELLAASGQFNSLVCTLERLIKTSFQMEQQLGLLLSRAALYAIAQEVIRIITEELRDVPEFEDIVDRVATRIGPVLESATNEPESISPNPENPS